MYTVFIQRVTYVSKATSCCCLSVPTTAPLNLVSFRPNIIEISPTSLPLPKVRSRSDRLLGRQETRLASRQRPKPWRASSLSVEADCTRTQRCRRLS